MGSDDLFHKRKAKGAKDLARKKSKREAYEKVLIVCEGSKTEPYYFEDIRNCHRLNTLNIIIEGTGKDPLSLHKRARELALEAERLGDSFDRIYCVFDKDEHTNYQQAVELITSKKTKESWFAITSVPCFEYWLLLHFIYTSKPFYPSEGMTAAQNVEKELKTYIYDYKKCRKGLYNELIDQLDLALNHAKKAAQEAARNQTDNPSTNLHELVEYLRNILNIT